MSKSPLMYTLTKPCLSYQLSNGPLGSSHGIFYIHQSVCAQMVAGKQKTSERVVGFDGLCHGSKRGVCASAPRQIQLQQGSEWVHERSVVRRQHDRLSVQQCIVFSSDIGNTFPPEKRDMPIKSFFGWDIMFKVKIGCTAPT